MAFDLVAAGGYGSGELGDVTNPVGQICTTAYASDYANGTLTLSGSRNVGIYGDFAAGMEVLIQIAGMSGRDNDEDNPNLGLWTVASISAVDTENNALGLWQIASESGVDASGNAVYFTEYGMSTLEEIFSTNYFRYQITVTSIPHFRNLTLNTGCYLTPRRGFPLAFKCSETFTLNGGHIDLRNKGLEGDGGRPLLEQEREGTADTDKYSGWENSETHRHFAMNYGDGAAFIIAKQLTVANTSSRIGNPNFTGVQFCRGASDSYNLPTNATNVGGSTIMLVAGNIQGFTPNFIAKYRDDTLFTGKGLARCYIASNTPLRNDEGLYAYDCIANPDRLSSLNIKSFGDGSAGSSSLTSQINNYAQVNAIDSTKKVLTVTGITTAGAAPLAVGALVMIHFNHRTSGRFGHSGRFILAKILGISGNDITIDTAVPTDLFNNLDAYACQIISVPQFSNYTLNTENAATPVFDGRKGGIFAIAVSNTCDLSDGKINVEGKGGGIAYGKTGLAYIGNAQDNDRLPIGQGHGSIFILAKNLTMNSSTRIGATYSGANTGGRIKRSADYTGYSGGGTLYDGRGAGGGYLDGELSTSYGGYGSSGYARNNSTAAVTMMGCQGAHIMIIADTITGFSQAAISTGGEGTGYEDGVNQSTVKPVGCGGAGYGGAGGKNGGKGGYNGGGILSDVVISSGFTNLNAGSSGWAFVYCNNVFNQNTTDTVIN